MAKIHGTAERFKQLSKQEYMKVRLNFNSFLNIVTNKDFEVVMSVYRLREQYQWGCAAFGEALGKPPYKDSGTENNQGVWCFLDTQTGITFAYYTDCYKKSAYKGGSLDLATTSPVPLEYVLQAAEDFLKFLLVGKSFQRDEDMYQAHIEWESSMRKRHAQKTQQAVQSILENPTVKEICAEIHGSSDIKTGKVITARGGVFDDF